MSRERRLFVIPFLIWAITHFSGCASVTGPVAYPESWAPIQSISIADGCPSLEGTFSNRGSGAFPTELGEPPRLDEVFARMGRGSGPMSPRAYGRTWSVPSEAESVSVSQAAESLSFLFIDKDGNKTPLNFRRYHFNWGEDRYDELFTCYNNDGEPRLRFLAEPESHGGSISNFYLVGGGILVFMLRTADGSLVVQWRSDSAAVSGALIGSGLSFKSVWWRYLPAKDVP